MFTQLFAFDHNLNLSSTNYKVQEKAPQVLVDKKLKRVGDHDARSNQQIQDTESTRNPPYNYIACSWLMIELCMFSLDLVDIEYRIIINFSCLPDLTCKNVYILLSFYLYFEFNIICNCNCILICGHLGIGYSLCG